MNGLVPLLLAGVLGGPAMSTLPPPSALLYFQLHGPAGTYVTYYPVPGPGHVHHQPVIVGVRPGYIYRTRITNAVGGTLYPTLEVRGALRVTQPGSDRKFPVPIHLSEADCDTALRGGLITRVYYLEDPAHAAPYAPANGVVEIPAGSEPIAIDEARRLGRLVLIVRLGGRQLTEADLMAQAIPGTMLLPGDPRLGPPAAPPMLPSHLCGLIDPLSGPKGAVEECLHDGGDDGNRLGIDPQGKLAGLDPADTAIEYTDGKGARRVESSNRVCVCVPRFACQRVALLPNDVAVPIQLGTSNEVQVHMGIRSKTHDQTSINIKHPAGLMGPVKPGVLESIDRLIAQQNAKAPLVVGQADGVQVTGAMQELLDITAYPSCKPMILRKWVDPPHGHQAGDVVTFYLRYTNTMNQPISNVVVSDSLTARLEYLPGSEKTDRAAAFTYTPNAAGSDVLRWELAAPLPAGQSGVVAFQTRIR